MSKNVKQKMYNFFQKIEKPYKIMVLVGMLIFVSTFNVFATQPKIVSGTVSLFKSISVWLLIIIPVGAGAMIGYHALQKTLTDDEARIQHHNKLMKNTLISAAVGMTADGLVTVFLAFYK